MINSCVLKPYLDQVTAEEQLSSEIRYSHHYHLIYVS